MLLRVCRGCAAQLPHLRDRFGASVALVGTSGDGVAELLVGAPGERVIDRGTDAGSVTAVGGAKGGPGPGSVVLNGPSASAAAWRSPRPT
ncbi:FG-GAP repeat protein [Streptomyces sp. NPDC057565]|uniref:FG-GAP repeat protein n=1 Tax=Streptomyces sp. NPDC057565 TaxID=3346169 RepID=UPI00367E1DBB